MMSAMAYVMIDEGLIDRDFIRTHCLGFDETQMPPGCEGEESYKDYILGTRDGLPKTPDLGRKNHGRSPGDDRPHRPGIRDEQTRRPLPGLRDAAAGLRRTAGPGGLRPGGDHRKRRDSRAAGPEASPCRPLTAARCGRFFRPARNPSRAKIPSFLWSEAVLRGKDMGWEDGLRGVESLGTDLKLIWSVASNILINQHANVNRSARILRDERLVEFLVVQDNFLTPTARFADLVLPACTQFETWGLQDGWKYGDDILLAPKILEPPGEAKSDYWIASELARRLGLLRSLHRGPDRKGLGRLGTRPLPGKTVSRNLPPSKSSKRNAGMYAVPDDEPAVAFAKFREDPQRTSPSDSLGSKSKSFPSSSGISAGRKRSRPFPNISGNGKAPSAPKPELIRFRPSAIMPCPGFIPLMTTIPPWPRDFPSACS